eukprot:9721134-Alexandrium_andersonii.AAC.1
MSECLHVSVSVPVPVPVRVSLSVSAHVLLRVQAVCMDGDGSDCERSFGLDFGHLLSVTSQEKRPSISSSIDAPGKFLFMLKNGAVEAVENVFAVA